MGDSNWLIIWCCIVLGGDCLAHFCINHSDLLEWDERGPVNAGLRLALISGGMMLGTALGLKATAYALRDTPVLMLVIPSLTGNVVNIWGLKRAVGEPNGARVFLFSLLLVQQMTWLLVTAAVLTSHGF